MLRNILFYQKSIITNCNKNFIFGNTGFYKITEKPFVDFKKMAVHTRKIRKGIL